MNEDSPTVGDLRLQMQLSELNRTIQFAHLRCLSVEEIVHRISRLDEGDDTNNYSYLLSEMQLTDTQSECLYDAISSLARRSEHSPSKLKATLDRTLLRLARLLPSELAIRFAMPFVDHRRKARRKWAYYALREKEISKSIAAKLIDVFHKTGDQDALQLVARHPRCVPEIGAVSLLENIDEKYWRARVIEALLIHDRKSALTLSHQYPFEFAHAAGRIADSGLLKALSELFDHNNHDIDFLSIYAYALGKLQGRDQLQSLEEFLATQ
jgi:hypothetical protein